MVSSDKKQKYIFFKNSFYSIFVFSFIFLMIMNFSLSADAFTIGRLKYKGGGDWYANPSSLPNLLRFIADNTNIKTAENAKIVSLQDDSIFSLPISYITGHGRIYFSKSGADKLRKYLLGGGFLFIDDNYGLDKFIRPEMKKVFPKKSFIALPLDHSVFKKPYSFPRGIPKIHKHHGGPGKALGIFFKGRLVVFYSYNTDLGDGWEDYEVHKDSAAKHVAALKMGLNVILFALSQGK